MYGPFGNNFSKVSDVCNISFSLHQLGIRVQVDTSFAKKEAKACCLLAVSSNYVEYTLQIPCRTKISSKLLRYRDKHIFAFKKVIQYGRRKWQENDFWEKPPVYSADTLRVKNFVEIALSRSVCEINVFLC